MVVSIFVWILSILFLSDILSPCIWAMTEYSITSSFSEYIKSIYFWYKAFLTFIIVYLNFYIQKRYYNLVIISFILILFFKDLILTINTGFTLYLFFDHLIKESIGYFILFYFLLVHKYRAT